VPDPSNLLTTGLAPTPLRGLLQFKGTARDLVEKPAMEMGLGGLNASLIPQPREEEVIANDTTAANELLTGQLDSGQIVRFDLARVHNDNRFAHIQVTSPKVSPGSQNQLPGRPTADLSRNARP